MAVCQAVVLAPELDGWSRGDDRSKAKMEQPFPQMRPVTRSEGSTAFRHFRAPPDQGRKQLFYYCLFRKNISVNAVSFGPRMLLVLGENIFVWQPGT